VFATIGCVGLALAGVGLAFGVARPPGPTPIAACEIESCATISVGFVGDGAGTIFDSTGQIACVVSGKIESGTCSNVFKWTPAEAIAGGGYEVTFDQPVASPGSTAHITEYGQPIVGPFVFNFSDGSNLTEGGSGDKFGFVFNLTSPTELAVEMGGSGSGEVTSSPTGINCGSACTSLLAQGEQVLLTATPGSGSVFGGWTGGCSDPSSSTCVLTLNDPTTLTAVFAKSVSTTTTTTTTTSSQPTTTTTSSQPTTTTTARTTSPTRTTHSPVGVNLIDVAAIKTKLGARVVEAELDLTERVTATLTLRRSKRTLAKKTFVAVSRGGDQILTLLVPRSASGGPAVLTLMLRDAAGGSATFTRTVKITRA
jgi:hypothetical protein